jgi:RNA polymerase I-specific transcription initiation factor RRN3
MPFITDMAQPPVLAPALKRKRDGESSPTESKRLKVSFSPVTDVRYLDDSIEKPLSLVHEEVRRALARHIQNENIEYNLLKSLFTTDPSHDDAPTNQLLHHHVIAFTSHVLSFSDNSGDLLHAVLNCHWLQRDEEFVNDVNHFLTALLTTYSGYVSLVLKWLMSNLMTVNTVTIAGATEVNQDQVFDRLHQTLQIILQLIPYSKPVIEPIIDSSFPYHALPTALYVNHVTNLLRIKSYEPDLSPIIMRTIIDKALLIDVQVGIDVDPLDEDEQDLLVDQVRDAMSNIDNLDSADQDQDEDEDEVAADNETHTPEAVLNRIKSYMMKLDFVIDSLFEYYDTCLSSDTTLPYPINSLLSTFTESILTTHSSRSLQYLLFRMAQLDKKVYERFMSTLLKSAFDRNLAMPTRCASVSYLASFAARGSRIDDSSIRSLFDKLSAEMERLRKMHESKTTGPDAERFRLYYTIFQGLMYIFCFRWKAFLLEPQEDESDDGYNWMPEIKEMFNRHVMSKLNPLKVCAPVLVAMFAKITKHLNFLYLYSRIEANKRVRLVRSIQFSGASRESTLHHKAGESALQLTNQYAFEPYVLPISKRWISGLYLNFDDVSPTGMDSDSSDDEDASDSDE